ncbi:hypothetical protein PJJ30_24240 [Mycobacterium kansasii]|uniref:hypothetical protein n=1 Tax=Mycobacterium TaxID=1763 RepID=UPI0009EF7EFA|nr:MULTISPECIES: hypothetical protein [Mycobacterium]ARG91387.1 hypothetical protein B1T50_04540 [Mycobacterium kansasii]POY12435.1 hypothetical protein C3472_24990 [Mycobacterium kansasii]VAZ77453.1 hypothetical protein LAUMK15_03825 [Mycobacterium persicum]
MTRRQFFAVASLTLTLPRLLRAVPAAAPLVCPTAAAALIHSRAPVRGTYAGWPQPGVPPQPMLV